MQFVHTMTIPKRIGILLLVLGSIHPLSVSPMVLNLLLLFVLAVAIVTMAREPR